MWGWIKVQCRGEGRGVPGQALAQADEINAPTAAAGCLLAVNHSHKPTTTPTFFLSAVVTVIRSCSGERPAMRPLAKLLCTLVILGMFVFRGRECRVCVYSPSSCSMISLGSFMYTSYAVLQHIQQRSSHLISSHLVEMRSVEMIMKLDEMR